MAPGRYADVVGQETDQGKNLNLGHNSGLDTRIDRLLQACIPVAEMGFPHLAQFGLGGPQLGLFLVHACRAKNEFPVTLGHVTENMG
jgi:hypothetical protein